MKVEPIKERGTRVFLSFVVLFPALLVFWILFPKTLSGDETLWNELAFQATNSRLYVDVFDHKDPGFLFTIIWSYKLFGPMGLPIISFVTKFVVIFLPSIWLNWKRSQLEAAKVLIVVLSFLFLPGMRDGSLPITLSNSLIIISAVSALEHKFFASGFVGGLTLFIKLSIAPIWLLAIILAAFFYRIYSRQVKHFLAGAGTAVIPITFLLWREGILPNWVEVVRFNQRYSTSGPSVRLGLPTDNLGLLKHDFARLDYSTKFFIFALIVFSISFGVSKMFKLSHEKCRPLLLVVIFGFIGSIITLGLSYVWLHHVQVLLPWLVLGTVVIVTETKSRFLSAIKFAFQVSIVVFLVMSVNALSNSGLQMKANFEDQFYIPSQWNDEFHNGSTYGYLSQNTGFIGSQLPKSLKLKCPDLAVFPWTSYRLDAHKNCLTESDFVFVQELDFIDLDSKNGYDGMFFNTWVVDVNRLLISDFCEMSAAAEFSNRDSVVRLFINKSLKPNCS